MGDTMIDWEKAPKNAFGAIQNPSTEAWHWLMKDSDGNVVIDNWAEDDSKNERPARLWPNIIIRPPVRWVTISGTLVRD